MKRARKITKDLFDENLIEELDSKFSQNKPVSWEDITNKPQLADEHWRSPVATVVDLPINNNVEEDVRLVLNTNEVYSWDGVKWILIGANDTNIEWGHIQNKPTDFEPKSHTHVESDIVDLSKSWLDIDGKPNSYSPSSHTHNELDIVDLDKYTKSEVDVKLDNKSDKTHNHDGSYYKKSEIDNKLSSKLEDVFHVGLTPPTNSKLIWIDTN